MVMQDFATAVQYNLPMTIFVLNNKQLSFIKYEQQAAGELEYAIDFLIWIMLNLLKLLVVKAML